MVKNLSSRAERFPKSLFTLSRCMITGTKDSEDLLSYSPVHVGARDGVNCCGGAAARRGKSLARLDNFFAEANRSYIYRTAARSRVAIAI